MNNSRQWHIYVGCFFAPLLIYFSLSGAWQMFRLNDLPKDEQRSTIRVALHELSRPHRNAVLPGKESNQSSSSLVFKWLSVVMAIGFTIIAMIGIQMGLQVSKRRTAVLVSIIAGIILPILLLLIV